MEIPPEFAAEHRHLYGSAGDQPEPAAAVAVSARAKPDLREEPSEDRDLDELLDRFLKD
jgi:hypothetical protein